MDTFGPIAVLQAIALEAIDAFAQVVHAALHDQHAEIRIEIFEVFPPQTEQLGTSQSSSPGRSKNQGLERDPGA